MFALTRNDAINSMAASEFSHLFGSKNVFRLKRRDEAKGDRAKVGHSAKGRELFADAWNQERLREVYEQGYRPKLTKMSEEFGFEDFLALNGNDVIVLMVIDKSGVITVNTADFELEPNDEQSVLALVKPEETDG